MVRAGCYKIYLLYGLENSKIYSVEGRSIEETLRFTL